MFGAAYVCVPLTVYVGPPLTVAADGVAPAPPLFVSPRVGPAPGVVSLHENIETLNGCSALNPLRLMGVTVKRGAGAVLPALAVITPALPTRPSRHAKIAPRPTIRRTGFLLVVRCVRLDGVGASLTARVRFPLDRLRIKLPPSPQVP